MRRTAALLLPAAVLAAGCTTSAPAAPPPADRLEAARRSASQLTSFAFRSVTELPGRDALQRTVVDGRAVVPDRVAYTLTVGQTRTEVIRIAGQTYSRTLPGGRWVRDPATSASPQPATVLQQVLAAADGPVDKGEVEFDGRRGRLVEVTLTADEVRSTGLLDAKGGSDVPVTLALDPDGRVLRLAVELPVSASTSTGVLRQVTTYGSFGSAPPVEPPIP